MLLGEETLPANACCMAALNPGLRPPAADQDIKTRPKQHQSKIVQPNRLIAYSVWTVWTTFSVGLLILKVALQHWIYGLDLSPQQLKSTILLERGTVYRLRSLLQCRCLRSIANLKLFYLDPVSMLTSKKAAKHGPTQRGNQCCYY